MPTNATGHRVERAGFPGEPGGAGAGPDVLHVITDLGMGGAETVLTRIAEALATRGVASDVVSLMPPGVLAEPLRRRGVPVRSPGMARGWPSPAAAVRLSRLVRPLTPRCVQGWMYHGNLGASWAARFAGGRPPVLWNVRHSLHDLAHEKPSTRAVIRAGALLSGTVAAIVYCSRASARQHEALGYAPAKTRIIPNGFDCRRFRPRPEARGRLRRAIGAAPGATLVGMIARNHPMKDVGNLLRAAAILRAGRPDVRLVLAGTGFAPDDAGAVGAVAAAGLGDGVALLGERRDVHEVLPGLDVLVLPSAWGEGFPNILGEAMACGVPCVATAVGDSAEVVGDHGLIVPPRDPAALAAALEHLLSLDPGERAGVGAAARARVVARFSLDEAARLYAELYAGVADRAAVRAAA